MTLHYIYNIYFNYFRVIPEGFLIFLSKSEIYGLVLFLIFCRIVIDEQSIYRQRFR